MAPVPGNASPGLDPGFELTYATLEELITCWSETAEVIVTAAAGLGNDPGGWSQALGVEVGAFARVWTDEVDQLRASAQSVQTRLAETIACYQAGDGALADAMRAPFARAGSGVMRPY